MQYNLTDEAYEVYWKAHDKLVDLKAATTDEDQPMSTPMFSWGIHNAEDFSHALEATYSEAVHWRIACSSA